MFINRVLLTGTLHYDRRVRQVVSIDEPLRPYDDKWEDMVSFNPHQAAGLVLEARQFGVEISDYIDVPEVVERALEDLS